MGKIRVFYSAGGVEKSVVLEPAQIYWDAQVVRFENAAGLYIFIVPLHSLICIGQASALAAVTLNL